MLQREKRQGEKKGKGEGRGEGGKEGEGDGGRWKEGGEMRRGRREEEWERQEWRREGERERKGREKLKEKRAREDLDLLLSLGLLRPPSPTAGQVLTILEAHFPNVNTMKGSIDFAKRVVRVLVVTLWKRGSTLPRVSKQVKFLAIQLTWNDDAEW